MSSFLGPGVALFVLAQGWRGAPGLSVWNPPHKKDAAWVWQDDPMLFPGLGQRDRAEHCTALADHKPFKAMVNWRNPSELC